MWSDPTAAGLRRTGAAAVGLDEQVDDVQVVDGSWEMTTWFGINGESSHPHRMGAEEPHLAPSARRARLAETIEVAVRNKSMMSHPNQLQGRRLQVIDWTLRPVGEAHAGGEAAVDEVVCVTTGHSAWQDTGLPPPGRPCACACPCTAPGRRGQDAGPWMQHCHILQHGDNGMMSELVVEP